VRGDFRIVGANAELNEFVVGIGSTANTTHIFDDDVPTFADDVYVNHLTGVIARTINGAGDHNTIRGGVSLVNGWHRLQAEFYVDGANLMVDIDRTTWVGGALDVGHASSLSVDGVNLGATTLYPWLNNAEAYVAADGLADNFSATYIAPEPSVFLLSGVGFFAMLRRRRN